MRYRTLGKTGLNVAEVGIGTWQLMGDPGMWLEQNPSESQRALQKYIEVGGNFIDTAWVYGFDDNNPDRHPSEELIGDFVKSSKIRDQVILATKVAPKNWHWPAWKTDKIEDCFPSDHIVKQVEDSLRSLQVETIDLVQFHVWQDRWVEQDEWKETVQKLIQSGKVRYWGISINDYQPENCLDTLKAVDFISTIQFIFNIFHQKPREQLLPYAAEHNIGLIARVPLDEGGLTGKFTKSTNFVEGDLRKKYFAGDRLGELVDRTNALKELMGTTAETLTEFSLRYILSHSAVSTVIPGMRKEQYVVENTSVSDGQSLTSEMLAELENHSWERNFYSFGDPALSED
ncbi:aldo/keto reductase [candidate division WWE3 bacterium]|uniref:Aldo/keto reductase n=1 Tax=candidate division WWE3 bacterium TaxID=2053526 RepID=A0A955RPS6_UNCKA|nr:aldo/keto reductase [candidate division WWE3 bacterium]